MEVFGGLFLLWTMVWVVYGILIFFIPFILYAIMKNTRRTVDLLEQIKSLQQVSSVPGSPQNLATPALPRETLGSFLFNKPAGLPSDTPHNEPARIPPKSTSLKLSSYVETDEK
jgi:hypothetical protein